MWSFVSWSFVLGAFLQNGKRIHQTSNVTKVNGYLSFITLTVLDEINMICTFLISAQNKAMKVTTCLMSICFPVAVVVLLKHSNYISRNVFGHCQGPSPGPCYTNGTLRNITTINLTENYYIYLTYNQVHVVHYVNTPM